MSVSVHTHLEISGKVRELRRIEKQGNFSMVRKMTCNSVSLCICMSCLGIPWK